jgi:hypothetical protein
MEIKRLTNVVGIFPNDTAIVRLVDSQLQEQQEEWQLERRRFYSEAAMAKIPDPEEPLGVIWERSSRSRGTSQQLIAPEPVVDQQESVIAELRIH